MSILFCGIDFHKNTSTICIMNEKGNVTERATKRTTSLVSYLANKKFQLVGIEASGGVNDFVDKLKCSGHEVKIINPKTFRLVGMNGKKTDRKDAQALAEGLRVNFIPEVHHKSQASRDIKALLVCREHAVSSRINFFNHIRGILREKGITMPQGLDQFLKNVHESINKLDSGFMRATLMNFLDLGNKLLEQEKEIEHRLNELTKDNENVKKLQTIPGVGPMTALAMIAITDDVTRFKNAKLFASYLGLVPRESSSAETKRMGRITRSGSEMLRRYLVHGARASLMHTKEHTNDSNRQWGLRLKNKVGMNKATVALAHRMARISFAMLRDGTVYGEVLIRETDFDKKNFSHAV